MSITVDRLEPHGVLVSFPAHDEATAYRVTRQAAGALEVQVAPETTQTRALLDGLTPGTTYAIRVYAVTEDGLSLAASGDVTAPGYGPTSASDRVSAYSAAVLTGGTVVGRDYVHGARHLVADAVEAYSDSVAFDDEDGAAPAPAPFAGIRHSATGSGANRTGRVAVRVQDGSETRETLVASADRVSVASRDPDSGAAAEAAMDGDGLSFDSHDAAVYFGAGREFRIRYVPGPGQADGQLAFQSLESDGSYKTRYAVLQAAPP